MKPVNSDSSALSLQATRQAMLVIHGIGEQNPYESLDSFARGVFAHFEKRNCRPRLRPIEITHKDWTQVGMHIDIFAPAPPTTVVDKSREARAVAKAAPKPPEGAPKAIGSVDIFEYYWAPLTE